MENIQQQQAKRPKTGGREKGTPNKVNASLKLFIKNILLDPQIIEAYRAAFLAAKPEALIAHYEKMMRFICAPQSNKENGGEWLPYETKVLELPTFMERNVDASHERKVAQEEGTIANDETTSKNHQENDTEKEDASGDDEVFATDDEDIVANVINNEVAPAETKPTRRRGPQPPQHTPFYIGALRSHRRRRH